MWLSSLVLFWGTILSWETNQVSASTTNDFLIILGTPWWINGLVNSGFACWWFCRMVELLYGVLVKDGSTCREIKPPCLQNEKRSRRRRNRRSALMACLILNQRRHFKKVKIKNEGWASYPATIPNLAMQDINFGEYDPSQIVDFLNKFPETTSEGVITVPLTKRANISSVKYPFCFSSRANEGNVIIDSGASVCISPHCSDFITYNESC